MIFLYISWYICVRTRACLYIIVLTCFFPTIYLTHSIVLFSPFPPPPPPLHPRFSFYFLGFLAISFTQDILIFDFFLLASSPTVIRNNTGGSPLKNSFYGSTSTPNEALVTSKTSPATSPSLTRFLGTHHTHTPSGIEKLSTGIISGSLSIYAAQEQARRTHRRSNSEGLNHSDIRGGRAIPTKSLNLMSDQPKTVHSFNISSRPSLPECSKPASLRADPGGKDLVAIKPESTSTRPGLFGLLRRKENKDDKDSKRCITPSTSPQTQTQTRAQIPVEGGFSGVDTWAGVFGQGRDRSMSF